MKKTEVLMENFRRAIGIKIKEVKEVFEGQVVSLVRTSASYSLSSTGYFWLMNQKPIAMKDTKEPFSICPQI